MDRAYDTSTVHNFLRSCATFCFNAVDSFPFSNSKHIKVKQHGKKITSITCPLCSSDGLGGREDEGCSFLCTNGETR